MVAQTGSPAFRAPATTISICLGCTPFLLSRISELTNGNSMKSNLALLLNNARLAADIAKEITVKKKEWAI